MAFFIFLSKIVIPIKIILRNIKLNFKKIIKFIKKNCIGEKSIIYHFSQMEQGDHKWTLKIIQIIYIYFIINLDLLI